MSVGFSKGRLEAFSDGVIAIIITIMVLELKVPQGVHGGGTEGGGAGGRGGGAEAIAVFSDLAPLIPTFMGYVLSFVYVGIYWNNHHHLLHATRRVDGVVLWANLHLLFWMSLIPFVTAWMGDHPGSGAPAAMYGFVLLMSSFAYAMLQLAIIRVNGSDSAVARAVGKNVKGKVSSLLYLVAIGLSFVQPWMAGVLYVAVAVMWFVPDRRIERTLAGTESAD